MKIKDFIEKELLERWIDEVKWAEKLYGEAAKFTPPPTGNAPSELKKHIATVYSSCRSNWTKKHPNDRENKGNKEMCSKIAWSAMEKAGWKNKDGKWAKS